MLGGYFHLVERPAKEKRRFQLGEMRLIVGAEVPRQGPGSGMSLRQGHVLMGDHGADGNKGESEQDI